MCLVLAIVVAGTEAGCKREEHEREARRSFLAVVGAGRDDWLWPVLEGTARRCGENLGDVELRVEAPAMTSVNAQASLVRRMASAGMVGLCLQVIDPEAAGPLLKEMERQGIAVVTMIHEVETTPPPPHCGWDEQELGIRMADTVAGLLPKGGFVALLEPGPRHAGRIHAPGMRASPPNDRSPGGRSGDELARHLRSQLSAYRAIHVTGSYAVNDGVDVRRALTESARLYPALDGWIFMGALDGCDVQDCPEVLERRFFVAAHPAPRALPDLHCAARVVAVGAEYEQLAPKALGQLSALLSGTGRMSSSVLVPIRVVDPSTIDSYRRDWRRWCAESTSIGTEPAAPEP
jgi:hypothetical protein